MKYEVIKYHYRNGEQLIGRYEHIKEAKKKLINALYEVKSNVTKSSIEIIEKSQIWYSSSGYVCISEVNQDTTIIEDDIIDIEIIENFS